MREVSATAGVPTTPDTLFAFVADPANLQSWQTGIVTAERTSDGLVGVGSTARVVRELMGQRLAVDLTITAYEPPRRLVLESAASGIDVRATLELDPADDSTRIRFAMGIEAQNPFMKPLERIVANAAERDLADSLERLRHHFAVSGR